MSSSRPYLSLRMDSLKKPPQRQNRPLHRRKRRARGGGEDELPTLEMVGDRVVGTSSSQILRLATPDVWKVIAPKGLIVRAGPGDDCLPLGRLKGVGKHGT